MRIKVLLLSMFLVLLGSPAWADDTPPPASLTARSSLPPGESGTFMAAGQAQFLADSNPGDFGPHVDDQRAPYWDFQTKDASFHGAIGTAETPATGVRIYRDPAGVPVIYGDSGYDVWYGEGYAAATDRLFELDGVRRLAEGRLAELTGPTGVPKDIQARVTGYTDAEYAQMLTALSPAGQDAVKGYAAGVEARINQVKLDPTLLPIEYTLLSSLPEDWTVKDTEAAGVYITRLVASQGAGEMDNVKALTELEKQYGKHLGRKVFEDVLWEEDPKAQTVIDGGSFSNEPASDRSAKAREASFQHAADLADALPDGLAAGPGTGAAAVPPVVSPSVPSAVTDRLARLSAGLEAWRASLHGGSFGFAIAGNRTASGHALLQSSPQLGYSYPGELYEIEVHGGGYDARGVGVPGIPTVGIGWNTKVAWALTTGYSKTIDSFIETTKPGTTPQWLHDGTWQPETCRTESVNYRVAAMGVPAGPALSSDDVQVCRTGHGPVLATTADGLHARSADYAMWGKELQNVEGILDWDRAQDLDQLAQGVSKVTWNENIVAADADGHIGFWHPGLYERRPAGLDQRFPTPGTGADDPTGFFSFAEMPHVVDPPAGYVVSWNTKPAHGWVDGDLSGGTSTRSGGPANRVTVIKGLLSARKDFTAADLPTLDTLIGSADMRAQGYLPAILALRSTTGLSAAETSALDLLAGWDGQAYEPGKPGGSSPVGTPAAQVTDGAAETLLGTIVGNLQTAIVKPAVPDDVYTMLFRQDPEEHLYDVRPIDNVILRVLRPGFSGLTPSMDWLKGASPDAVVKAALDAALMTLGSDQSTWHAPHKVSHLTSLTDVVGPTGVTMPFEDRGSWVHQIAFTTGKPYAVPGVKKPVVRSHPVVRAPGSLAATGGGWWAPLVGSLLLGLGLLLRRRRSVDTGPVLVGL